MKKTRDPLTALVNDAVENALERRLDPFLAELADRTKPALPASPHLPEGADRYVSMSEMAERLGVDRSTVNRREKAGKIPPRRRFPDGRKGWLARDIDDWFARAKSVVITPPNSTTR